MNRTCKACKTQKHISEYYTFGNNGHRYYKCKDCKNKSVSERRFERIKDPVALDKERQRGREKYHASTKTKPSKEAMYNSKKRHNEKYPEKNAATTAAWRHFKEIPVDTHKHHWSYNKAHWIDVIFINNKDHATAHRFIVYDQERMMYRTKDGILLDTKEAHVEYINQFIETKIAL